MTGLTPGTTYRFAVRAVNDSGPGTWSNVATATTKPVVSPPTGLHAFAYDSGAALDWTAGPGHNFGTTYTITVMPGHQHYTQQWPLTDYHLDNLTNGVHYRYSVVASSMSGGLDSARVASKAFVPFGRPTHNVSHVRVTRIHRGLKLSWRPPKKAQWNGHRPRYEVVAEGRRTRVLTTKSNHHRFDNLAVGSFWRFEVSACAVPPNNECVGFTPWTDRRRVTQ